eukprot:4655992-Alexandrium_andersonii.AAC.1
MAGKLWPGPCPKRRKPQSVPADTGPRPRAHHERTKVTMCPNCPKAVSVGGCKQHAPSHAYPPSPPSGRPLPSRVHRRRTPLPPARMCGPPPSP